MKNNQKGDAIQEIEEQINSWWNTTWVHFQSFSYDIHHDAYCTFFFFFFFVFCCGIPPAIHEAVLGFPLEFGPSQQKSKQQEVLGGATWHTVTLWSLYLTPTVIPGELLLCPKPAEGTSAPAPASTLAQLSAKGPGSHSEPGADAFTDMGQHT